MTLFALFTRLSLWLSSVRGAGGRLALLPLGVAGAARRRAAPGPADRPGHPPRLRHLAGAGARRPGRPGLLRHAEHLRHPDAGGPLAPAAGAGAQPPLPPGGRRRGRHLRAPPGGRRPATVPRRPRCASGIVLLIAPGELVPVDATLLDGAAAALHGLDHGRARRRARWPRAGRCPRAAFNAGRSAVRARRGRHFAGLAAGARCCGSRRRRADGVRAHARFWDRLCRARWVVAVLGRGRAGLAHLVARGAGARRWRWRCRCWW